MVLPAVPARLAWLAVLPLMLTLSATPAQARNAAPPEANACVSIVDSEVEAAATAKRCGSRVEAQAERSEHTQVFANPDGSRTLEESLRPRFAKAKDGSWVTPDATLVANPDGTLSPRASVFPIIISGGGLSPLASLRKPGGSVAVSWPATLPKPVVSGATATYPEVQPGVDLRIVSDVDAVSELLVVKNPAAAARLRKQGVDLGVTADANLSMTADSAGVTTAKDKQGRTVFSSGSTRMWDSSGDGAQRDPKEGSVAVATDRAGRWKLMPDQSFLNDPGLVYPIVIDPDFTGAKNHWTLLRKTSPTHAYWDITDGAINSDTDTTQGLARVGLAETGFTDRSVFEFDTDRIKGTHVLAAKVTLFQRWSGPGCSQTGGDIGLYWVSQINSSTNWSNFAGDWGGAAFRQSTTNSVRRNGGTGNCAPANIEMVIPSPAAVGLGSSSAITLGLKGENESNINTWKRFANNTTTSPTITITYNSYPTVGARSTSPATSCVAGTGSAPAANPSLINDSTPELRAYTNDDDTEVDLKAYYEWQKWNGSTWLYGGMVVDNTGTANGGQSSAIIPTLTSAIYRWNVMVADPWSLGSASGVDYSAASPWCEFQLDATPPPIPAVSSLEYPDNCAPCGGIGTTGRFTLIANASDVDGYWWGFSDPPNNWIPTTNGAPQTFDWTPTSGGPRTLFVRSRDLASNVSALRTDYDFTVDGADPLRARWRLTEQPDDDGNFPPLVDSTGNGFTATMSGGGGMTNGRLPGATAIAFDGVNDLISTTGPVIQDTTKSFSVSAWVNLASEEQGSKTILTQEGGGNSAFVLEYVNYVGLKMWRIYTPLPDGVSGSAPYVVTAWSVPKVGQWSHLVGVYDSAAKTLKLYVDGVLAGTTGNVTTRSATGAFKIGGSMPWHGSISDVKVWQRVLFDSEVRDMTDPLVEAKAGEYHFGETDSTFALDSSNYGHTLSLSGGASIPSSGAGYDGPGLLLMDGTGVAQSDGPSVYTSQSFTVSAWVRIDGTSLPARNFTAIGQSGEKTTAFKLAYEQYGANHWWAFSMAGSDVGGGGSTVTSMWGVGPEVLGKWVHLAGTFNAATNSVQLFVNGAPAGAANRTTVAYDVYGPLTVGAAQWSPTGGTPAMADFWSGAIDEVRIYQGIVPQVAGDWRFDSCTGTPVVCADSATPAHAVTLSGDATWTPGGHAGGSGLSFNGTGSAATTAPVVNTAQSFTVSAWVKLGDTSASRCAVCLDGTNVDSFVLGYEKSRNAWGFWGHDVDSDSTAMSIAAGSAPTLNTWTHLTGVYDAVQGEMRLYVNGGLASTTKFTKGWQAGGPLVVGREKWNGLTSFWKGGIDDVRVQQGVISDPASLMD